MPHRAAPEQFTGRRFDLIVIGAGINGIAIARDAARRGLSVAVLDKGDVASGTTSWSTRLVHGGLRYLEHFEFRLVRESLRERERLLRNAPHLVHPIPLLLPIYEGGKRGAEMIRLGMLLYDGLSFDKTLPRHRMLGRDETLSHAPGLDPDGLTGGALYYDAQIALAERLAVETAIDAAAHGALIGTYCAAERILSDGAVVRGIEAHDLISGQRFTVKGRTIVNAAGPWVDAVLAGAPAGSVERRFMGGTKGSHIVVNPFPGAPTDAIYYEAKTDGRAIFIVPWLGMYLIGTTDIRYDGDLDHIEADDAEVAYLLAETNALMPKAGLTESKVLYTYSGVRPLPYTADGNAGAISRDHTIHNHAPHLRGLWSVIGGKLTTQRALAEQVVNALMPELGASGRCTTARTPLPGAAAPLDAIRAVLLRQGLAASLTERLLSHYGSRARDIGALITADASLGEEIDAVTGAIAAEVVFAVREEMATTLADILLRRTMIGLTSHAGVGPDRVVADVAMRHLGWDADRADREIAAFRSYIIRYRPRTLAVHA